jgi:Zn finger protein HypA/HybF involved in hydrogenase expression
MNTNPLRQFFRQPAIHIRLPSQGRYYPTGVLVETANGEYPVLPMTTMDEITYRTPDALFNGSAVATVIQSCVPAIRDAWQMPNLDLDTVLIAVRIASYGHNLDLGSKCPSCGNEADYTIDLRSALERIGSNMYDKPLTVGDLEFQFQPLTYRQVNANNMAQFEEQKRMQALERAENDEQRASIMSDLLRRLTDVTTDAVAHSIASITAGDVTVTDAANIREYLANCDRAAFNTVKEHVIQCKAASEVKPIRLKCTNCGHEYEQSFTLDMSNFFADAS